MADYSRASIRRQVLFLVLVAFFTSGALADRLVRPIRALAEGVGQISCFALPDYTEEDYGARAHPNAVWNQKAGLLLADYLKALL